MKLMVEEVVEALKVVAMLLQFSWEKQVVVEVVEALMVVEHSRLLLVSSLGGVVLVVVVASTLVGQSSQMEQLVVFY